MDAKEKVLEEFADARCEHVGEEDAHSWVIVTGDNGGIMYESTRIVLGRGHNPKTAWKNAAQYLEEEENDK